MSRMVGTVSRGIRTPIIRSGDDLVEMVTSSLLEAAREDGFTVRDRDIVAMTEAIVARAQGNYASVDNIAADVRAKLGGETIGVIFPILSRNRFAICLRGIAKGCKKVVLMLSYPSDEVGNHLISLDAVDEKGVDHLFAPLGDAPQADGEAVAAEDGENHTNRLPAQLGADVGGDLVYSGVVALGPGHNGLGHGHDIPVPEGKAVLPCGLQQGIGDNFRQVVPAADDGGADTPGYCTDHTAHKGTLLVFISFAWKKSHNDI